MKLVIMASFGIPEVGEKQWQAVDEAARAAGCTSVIARDTETQLVEIEDADMAFGRVTKEALARATKLRWVQSVGAGVDAQLYSEFIEAPVTLTSEKGLVGTHLSEHAFGLLLALTRGINTAIRAKRWDARIDIRGQAWELPGRTMGVIGLGGTGVEVARRAVAFGMDVIAMDPEPVDQPPFVVELWGLDRFHELLRRSDAVVITCPLAPSSKNMFNAAAFAQMRPHAVLVNVSRGEVVDMEALIDAVRRGLIAGAGLDVTPIEPLPTDNPLWAMDNVIITFHTAGASPHRGDRIVDRFRRNLARFQAGEPLEGVIDKVKGY
ncbi:MAG: D-2-hydroxyacid dehydrogenase [Dehalococcoidia bacterium]